MRCAPAARGTVNAKVKSTSSGDRTHDHKIKSLALYHLSYGGPLDGTMLLRMHACGAPCMQTKKGIHKPGIEPGTFCV